MGFNTLTGNCTPDELLAGNFPIVTEPIILASGTNYPRGAALGRLTGVTNYILSDPTKEDGSEKIVRVLMDPVDATDEAMPGIGALSGDFNNGVMTFGGSATAADFTEEKVRDTIFIHKTAKAVQP